MLLNNTINISIGKNASMSTNNDFMFDCVKCPAQFNGLRELRKHTCKSQNSKNDGESMTINERPKDKSEKENWREVDKSTKNVAVENNVNTLESYTIQEYIEDQFDISEDDQRPLDFKGKVQGTVVVERATNLDIVSQQSNKCKTCFRTFRDDTIFQKHISLCNGVWKMKNYRCHICEKKCSQKDNLRNHMKTHDPNWKNKERILVSCIQCGNQYNGKPSLKNHIRNTHKTGPEGVTVQCKFCSKTLASKYSLFTHNKLKHSEKQENIICLLCKKVFDNETQLKVHQRQHTRVRPIFSCEHCGVQKKSEIGLETHLATKHQTRLTLTCDQCGVNLATDTLLKYHLIHTHADRERFTCNVCEKVFNEKKLADISLKASHWRKAL